MLEHELQFLHGQSYREYRFCVDKSYERYAALQFMSKGTVQLSYEQQPSKVLSGAWVWPCNPGSHVVFQPGPSGSWEHHYIAVSGSLLQQWIASDLWPQLEQQVKSPSFEDRFLQLLDCYKRMGPWSWRRSVNLLEGLLLELAEQREAEPQRQEMWLSDCLRQMAACQYQSCAYEEIAASWGMSLSTLRRRFKQQKGVSIHQYALQQRLALAQHLLRETQQPIKAIADELGYSDVFFFSRQFKQHIGQTPGLYRQSQYGL